MKNWLIILFAFASFTSQAQVDTTAPFRKFPTIPPLQLTQLNKQLLTKDKLKDGMPVIIMFFSPDCDHCQHQTNDMIARMKDLSKYQIIFATHEAEGKLLTFRNKFKLDQYNNVLLGRDVKFLLPPFYRIRNFPYLALYNSRGQLVNTYEGNVTVDTILAAFKNDAAKKSRSLKSK